MNLELLHECRDELEPLLDLSDYGELPEEAQKEIRVEILFVYFVRRRAVAHVDAGYPDNQFRLRSEGRNERMKELIQLYRVYLEGIAAKKAGRLDDDNPYMQVVGKMSKHGINLESHWQMGFEGRKFQ